jgi:hypothetical protein
MRDSGSPLRWPPQRRSPLPGAGATTASPCATVATSTAATASDCPRFREAHAVPCAEKLKIPCSTCGDCKRASHRLKRVRGPRNGAFARPSRRPRRLQEPPGILRRRKQAVPALAAAKPPQHVPLHPRAAWPPRRLRRAALWSVDSHRQAAGRIGLSDNRPGSSSRRPKCAGSWDWILIDERGGPLAAGILFSLAG